MHLPLVSLLHRVLMRLCVLLMALLLACVLWQVLSRYVLASPSTFTDELARFLFIWLALLGSAAAFAQGAHLAVTLLVQSLAPRWRAAVGIFCLAISALFALLVMGLGGVLLMLQAWQSGQLSPVMGLSMLWFYAAVPLAGICIAMIALCQAAEHWRQFQVPHQRRSA